MTRASATAAYVMVECTCDRRLADVVRALTSVMEMAVTRLQPEPPGPPTPPRVTGGVPDGPPSGQSTSDHGSDHSIRRPIQISHVNFTLGDSSCVTIAGEPSVNPTLLRGSGAVATPAPMRRGGSSPNDASSGSPRQSGTTGTGSGERVSAPSDARGRWTSPVDSRPSRLPRRSAPSAGTREVATPREPPVAEARSVQERADAGVRLAPVEGQVTAQQTVVVAPHQVVTLQAPPQSPPPSPPDSDTEEEDQLT